MDEFAELKRRLQSQLRASDMAQANRTAEALIAGFPDRPEGWAGIAAAAEALFPADVALDRIRTAYGNAPQSGPVTQQYFGLLLRHGDIRAAKQVARDVVARGGENGRADNFLARIAQRVDDWPASVAHWKTVHDRQPDLPGPVRQIAASLEAQGDVKGALSWLGRLEAAGKLRVQDEIALVRLHAAKDGRHVSLEDSTALLQSLDHAEGAAVLHVNVLAREGDGASAVSFAEDYLRQHPKARNMHRRLAQLQMLLGYHRRAADLFHQNPAFLRKDPASLTGYVNSLARLGRHREAHEFLDSVDIVTTSASLAARYRLFTAEGDNRSALRSAAALYRFCPDLEAHGNLAIALLNHGRFQPARRTCEAIAARFGEFRPAWRTLATLSTSLADVQQARTWFERVFARPPQPVYLSQAFSDILWQFGLGTRAWCAALASATGEADFAAPDAEKRKAALRRLAGGIRQRAARLDQLDGQAREHEAAKLAGVFKRAYVSKLFRRPNAEVDRALADFSAAEAAGDAHRAVEVLRPALSGILASTASQNKLFLLLTRLARLEETLGDTADALAHLELAARMMGPDRTGIMRTKRLLQRHGPWMKVGHAADPGSRVPILIQSWAGGLEEAQRLARHIHANLDRTAITVVGAPEIGWVQATTRDYGYDLRVPADDGYAGLPRKLALAFRHLFACSQCTGVLKLDDDIAVTDFARFEAMIRGFSERKSDYAGNLFRGHNPIYHFGRGETRFEDMEIAHQPDGYYCGGGEGYYLSRRALSVIFEQSLAASPPDAPGVIYEDAYIGTLLRAGGVEAEHFATTTYGGFQANCFEPLSLPDTIDEVLAAD